MWCMSRHLKLSSTLLMFAFVAYPQGALTGTKTLTIRGGEADPGDTIQMPDNATVSVTTGVDGIVVTLPDVDVRMRCLGDVTADGYCYLAASGADLKDNDGDGIPDSSDDCDFTPPGAWTNSKGCSDLDNDGVHGVDDHCPEVQGPTSNNGCPITATTYTVTPSVSGGNGSITPSSAVTVQENRTTTFTLSPNANYVVDTVTGCGGTLSDLTYATGPVTSDCTVTATFKAEAVSGVGYCAGATSDVECSTSKTLDPLGDSRVWQQVAPDSNRVTNGKILSVPFTYKGAGSTRDAATMKMNSNMSALLAGFQFNVWISRRAAGVALASGKCQDAYTTTQGKYLTLNDQGGNFTCGLAAGEVYHANFEVRCSSEAENANPSYNSAIPETDWHPDWLSGKRYSSGDNVVFSGGLYSALQTHTASASQKPSTVCSNCNDDGQVEDEAGNVVENGIKDYDNEIWNYLQVFNPTDLPVCPDKTLRWDSADYGVTGGYYFELSTF